MSEPILRTPVGQAPVPRAPQPPSAPVLLLLSAVFPGLGHLAAGRRRTALIFAAPILVLLGLLALYALIVGAPSVAARLLDPAVLLGLLVLQGALLGWRLAAVGAVARISRIRGSATTLVAVAVAIAIVLGPQLVAGVLTIDARDAAISIFQPSDTGGAYVPTGTPPPVASDDPNFGVASPSTSASASPGDSPTPTPTGSTGQGRINVLLIGIDSGIGRNTANTDTMIVASLDPTGKMISMASVPRDTVDVPLPDGRIYKQKLNSLVSYVRWHPKEFPGAPSAESVLAAAIGGMLGLQIDMWAEVSLPGFVAVVDSVGGLNIRVTDAFCDPRYKEYGISGFNITPGWYHMNGDQALAYSRIREAAGQSDFTRAARQQEVIAAMRDKLLSGGFLNNPAGFLSSLGGTIRTNITPSFIAQWIDVASQVQRGDTYRTVIKYPLVQGMTDGRGSIQEPDLLKIQAMAAQLFPAAGTTPSGFDTMPADGSGSTRSPSNSSTCGIAPAPGPTTAPGGTPTPTPTDTGAPTPGSTDTPTPAPTEAPTPTPGPTDTPTPAPSV